ADRARVGIDGELGCSWSASVAGSRGEKRRMKDAWRTSSVTSFTSSSTDGTWPNEGVANANTAHRLSHRYARSRLSVVNIFPRAPLKRRRCPGVTLRAELMLARAVHTRKPSFVLRLQQLGFM